MSSYNQRAMGSKRGKTFEEAGNISGEQIDPITKSSAEQTFNMSTMLE